MHVPFPDHLQMANLPLMEEMYRKYLANPTSVEASWRYFFEGIDFASYMAPLTAVSANSRQSMSLRIFTLIQAYRRFGHLVAHIDPLNEKRSLPQELELTSLGFSEEELGQTFPALGFCGKKEATLQEILADLQRIYGSNIGFEYMDLGHVELEKWLSNRLENSDRKKFSSEEKLHLCQELSKAELFEQFLHMKYAGKTRFSLEGIETLIPLLLEIIKKANEQSMQELVIGMAHRGRLNLLAHVLEKPFIDLFREFEDDTILSRFGSDDVKYHMGFSKKVSFSNAMTVSMAPNPSHLESVDPVVLGQVRALQEIKGDKERKRIGALLIHGDAALSGQGVIYETLQLMNLPAYSIGGTIHIVANNQIGYTTTAQEGRSTRYCTDIAKAFGSPVFHVNAEDPESCLYVAQLAVEIRQLFQCDVFIDLVGYRKYGHNEGDEPSYTQPLQYQIIRTKPSICALYKEQSQHSKSIEVFEAQYKQMLAEALESAKALSSTPPLSIPSYNLLDPFLSGVNINTLRQIGAVYCQPPPQFHVHTKLNKWLQERLTAITGDPFKLAIDWSAAECLAFGSLLLQAIPIRLAGQDAKRGTFSQRHLILIDEKTGETDSPLQRLSSEVRLEVVNTPLTEFAGMAFEYGYSVTSPKTLVLWEAQYGDFNNSAQVIIDQYLVSAEHKWNMSSSLTLLLPHAYEGAGPEHSSARLERFLQLAAENNIQVVNASTPVQYFHLLRRQALRSIKKPLIVFTPKSLLRSTENMSCLNDFTSGSFQEILNDPTPPTSCNKILFCSGKIFYELYAEKIKKSLTDLAIIRIEQFYPFHHQQLQSILSNYKNCQHWCWVQEEPQNAGGWNFIRPYLQKHLSKTLLYIGRPENPTTATGSYKKHKEEQKALVDQAVGALPQTPPKD